MIAAAENPDDIFRVDRHIGALAEVPVARDISQQPIPVNLVLEIAIAHGCHRMFLFVVIPTEWRDLTVN